MMVFDKQNQWLSFKPPRVFKVRPEAGWGESDGSNVFFQQVRLGRMLRARQVVLAAGFLDTTFTMLAESSNLT